MLIPRLQEIASEALSASLGLSNVSPGIEIPSDRAFGDIAVNTFAAAKAARMPPPKIAETLATALAGQPLVASAQATKGYVNLRLAPAAMFPLVFDHAVNARAGLGRTKDLAGLRVMVEYSAPNTNKPLHLGHMRNNFLGHSVSAILAASGASVVRANLYNDRGIHICKSMLAYRKFGAGSTPESTGRKSDHFVGDYYVLFERKFQEEVDEFIRANPGDFEAWAMKARASDREFPADEKAQQAAYRSSLREEGFARIPLGAECTAMLRAWEAGDPAVKDLWDRMNSWAFQGFDETYRRLGVAFDKVYRESETWMLGRDLVLEGLERGVFTRRADGAVEIDLSAEKLDRKVVLRPDGTSVYITQDIGSTVLKARDFDLDRQIWVVGDEQRFHLQVLFRILERMGYPWAKDLHHLAYGMVNLPEGKMKSREGRVVDADDLMDEVAALAAEEIRARDPDGKLDEAEIRRRSEVVGLSSLRFMLLKVAPANTMLFNPAESVRFDGDTGARVLYAYARLRSILAEAKDPAPGHGDPGKLVDDSERALGITIAMLEPTLSRACSSVYLLR